MISEIWYFVANVLSIFYFPEWVFRKWRRNQHAFFLRKVKRDDAIFGQNLIFLDYSVRTHKFIPSK